MSLPKLGGLLDDSTFDQFKQILSSNQKHVQIK